MTEFILPFPPSELSPNQRLHWSKVARVKRAYREACWAQTLEQKASVPGGDTKLALYLTFYKPNRREMDRDNLLARMKSGLDGVADALKINDKRFDPVVVSVSDDVGGFVRVRIQGEIDGEKTI
jgi:crossover junction endodeoxyribonuclease RusA